MKKQFFTPETGATLSAAGKNMYYRTRGRVGLAENNMSTSQLGVFITVLIITPSFYKLHVFSHLGSTNIFL